MKKLMIALLFVASNAFAVRTEAYKKELREALWGDGAKAKVVFVVKDPKGKAVHNAYVKAGFWLGGKKGNGVLDYTDENGRLIAEKYCTLDVNYLIEKRQYYETIGRYKFSRQGEISVKDGKWIPYGKEIDVILKPMKNPIPMYVYVFDGTVPKGSFEIKFDFFEKDWLPPHGKGKHADMVYRYDEKREESGDFDVLLTLSFPDERNGATVLKKDLYSVFHSIYEVGEIKGQSLTYKASHKNDTFITHETFSKDDYLTFRIRTKLDDQGKIISAYYGKIYGPITYPHAWTQNVKFSYYLNPTANDRNIEYDGKNNLFKPSTRDWRQDTQIP